MKKILTTVIMIITLFSISVFGQGQLLKGIESILNNKLGDLDGVLNDCMKNPSQCFDSKKLDNIDSIYSEIKKLSKKNKSLDKIRSKSVYKASMRWADSYKQVAYGNWCGKGHDKTDLSVIDELDQACKDHDVCYVEIKKKPAGDKSDQCSKCDPPFVKKTMEIALRPKGADTKLNNMIDSSKSAFVFFKIKTILGFEL